MRLFQATNSSAADGTLAVLYETHRVGLLNPSWAREVDLERFRRHILLYWTSDAGQLRQNSRSYRLSRSSAARSELSRSKEVGTLPRGTRRSRMVRGSVSSAHLPFLLLPAFFGKKRRMGCGHLGNLKPQTDSSLVTPRQPWTQAPRPASRTLLYRARCCLRLLGNTARALSTT